VADALVHRIDQARQRQQEFQRVPSSSRPAKRQRILYHKARAWQNAFPLRFFDRFERVARAAVVSLLPRCSSCVRVIRCGTTSNIRIDVIAGNLSRRTQMWMTFSARCYFLLPMALYITWLSWPIFMTPGTATRSSGQRRRSDPLAGTASRPRGLLLAVPAGRPELIKRNRVLMGLIPDPL